MGENIDKFDEFPAIYQYFPDQDDDKMNMYIGIHQ